MTWRTPWRLAELNNLISALNIYDGAIAYGYLLQTAWAMSRSGTLPTWTRRRRSPLRG